MQQTNYSEKVFVIERFRHGGSEGDDLIQKPSSEDVEYRIGYYIIGKIGNKNGRWTWGQYCPFIPKRDFNKLIELAKREKVIL